MSISRGLRRWSRRGEWCTPGQPAHYPRMPRCACSRAQGARLSAQCVFLHVPVAGAGAGAAGEVIREGTPTTGRTRGLASKGWDLEVGRNSAPPPTPRIA